jgi:hypothetical protein
MANSYILVNFIPEVSNIRLRHYPRRDPSSPFFFRKAFRFPCPNSTDQEIVNKQSEPADQSLKRLISLEEAPDLFGASYIYDV